MNKWPFHLPLLPSAESSEKFLVGIIAWQCEPIYPGFACRSWRLQSSRGEKSCAGVQDCCSLCLPGTFVILPQTMQKPSSGFIFISSFYPSSKAAFRNTFSVPHCLQICISVLNGLNSRDGCRVHILGFYGSKWNFFQDCLPELI